MNAATGRSGPGARWDLLEKAAREAAVERDPVVILPLAATEQHGPHLPLTTDVDIGEGILAEALAALPADPPVYRLPVEAVGVSPEHLDFPGTRSRTLQELAERIVESGRALARDGVRRLLLFNSHGGNKAVADSAALRLRREAGLLVVKAHYFRFPRPEPEIFPPSEWTHGLHGGAVETAMMLHLHPDRVRTGAVAPFPSLGERLEAELERVQPEGVAPFAWLAQDLNAQGVTGDATLATPEAGAALVAHYAGILGEVIQDTLRFPLEALAPGAGVDRELDELFRPLLERERFVVGQLGQSLDGRIATESGHSHYINGPGDIRRLHRLRSVVDAVVVGPGTVAHDDPRLTVREVDGENPVRVILDPSGRLDAGRRVFNEPDAPTLWIQGAGGHGDPDGTPSPALPDHVTVLTLPLAADGGFDPAQLLELLDERGLRRILVEGGGVTVSRFLEAGLLDRLQISVAPLILGSGRPGIRLPVIERLDQALRPPVRHFRLGTDLLFDLDLRAGAG